MGPQNIDKSIIEKVLNAAKRIYYKIPRSVRWILWPVRFIFRFFNILRLDLWTMMGDEISTGKKLTIFYAGRELDKNFLVNLVFEGTFEENYIGKK